MRIHIATLIAFVTTLAVGPATALADPAREICDHLAEFAEDYDEEDEKVCMTEVGKVFEELSEAKRTELATCVTGHEPITKDQFSRCLTDALGLPDVSGEKEEKEAPAEPQVVPAQVTAVCKHVEANAKDYDDRDAEWCRKMLTLVTQTLDEAQMKQFSTCVTDNDAPTSDDVEACLQGALGETEAPAQVEPMPKKAQ